MFLFLSCRTTHANLRIQHGVDELHLGNEFPSAGLTRHVHGLKFARIVVVDLIDIEVLRVKLGSDDKDIPVGVLFHRSTVMTSQFQRGKEPPDQG